MADNNYTRAQPRRRLMLLSAALCLSLATAQVQTGERQCYWPNGQPSGYRPCSKDGGACCYNLDADHRDACYSNGMCQSGYFGNFYRGACTDRNWGGSCPNICKQVSNAEMDLRFCKQMDGWCCQASDSRDDCCAQGVGFQWLNATQVNYNVVPVESASFVYELTYTATSDPVAISALTKSLSLANAPTATALGTGLIIATTSATTGVTGGSTGATSAAGSAEGKCPNDNAVLALGAGLGVGLGVPLLAALAGLCWLASKQRRYKRVSTTTSDPSTAGVTATSGMGMTMSGPNSPFSPQYPYGGGDYQRQQHGQAYQRESYFDRSNVGAQGGGHAGYMGMGHQQGAGEMKTELPGHSAAAELPGRQWQS